MLSRCLNFSVCWWGREGSFEDIYWRVIIMEMMRLFIKSIEVYERSELEI